MVVLKRRNGLVCFQNIFGEIYFMEFPCGVFKGVWNGEEIYFDGKYILYGVLVIYLVKYIYGVLNIFSWKIYGVKWTWVTLEMAWLIW